MTNAYITQLHNPRPWCGDNGRETSSTFIIIESALHSTLRRQIYPLQLLFREREGKSFVYGQTGRNEGETSIFFFFIKGADGSPDQMLSDYDYYGLCTQC